MRRPAPWISAPGARVSKCVGAVGSTARLDGAAYALRRVLRDGRTLEAAAAAAVAADPGFDFGTGLFELFGAGMVVGVEMSTPRRKGTT